MKKIITIIYTLALFLISINPVLAQALPADTSSSDTDNSINLSPTLDESLIPFNTSVVPDGSYPDSVTNTENDSVGGSVTNTGSQVKKSSLDYSGWVQCDGVIVKDNSEPGRKTPCNFVNLINMVNHLINWAFMISIPIFVGLLAYAGFLLMTGKEADRTKSREMLWNALKGFVIMLLAWFIVTTLLKWLVNDDFIKSASTLVGQTK
jgi:hypothetical protein